MAQEFNPQFQKIGDILVHEGKISDSQLNSALAEQKVRKEKLGTVLLDQGLITEDDLVKVYSMQLGYDLA
ncbi:MAG: pilus assembly protein PilB, partial [Candidatus Neomarinimicrobiota bacterium]|nr:pilus assembly protein PilB [Candidatus Neomarinimicrobiota bacterium]